MSGFYATMIGAIIGLVGVFIGSRLSTLTAIEIINRQTFNNAASIFRAAFVNEIFRLQKNIKNGSRVPDEIITLDVLISHEKAKIIFEPFLTKNELLRFNIAWEKYKNSESIYDQDMTTKDGAINADPSKVYLDNINYLLEFGKPKFENKKWFLK